MMVWSVWSRERSVRNLFTVVSGLPYLTLRKSVGFRKESKDLIYLLRSNLVGNMSDCEDLPSFQSPLKKIDDYIEEDKIVWARWKGVYWPALVRKCFKKQRKATIVYTDAPCNSQGKEMRHNKSFRQLVNFDNSPESQQLMQGNSNDKRLNEAIELAKDYALRKALGKLFVSPLEFFLNPKSNLSANPNKEIKIKRKIEPNDALKVNKILKVSNEVKDDSSTEENENTYTENLESSNTDVDEEEEKTKKIVERLGAKLKQEMESTECYEHLLEIANNKTKSSRHTHFSDNSLTQKQKRSLMLYFFTSIINDIQLNEVINHLKSKLEGKLKIKRVSFLNYILDVTVPEALIFGMQKVLKISREEAEAVLLGETIPELEYDNLIRQFPEQEEKKDCA